ncbi:MAG TPA: hypothetical protein VM100_05685 [Longimicrobiales bacterium]|nr:hypothetical protein [Longimicrobiales bacterium]
MTETGSGVPNVISLTKNSSTFNSALKSPPDSLWTALTTVFKQLELPVATSHPQRFFIGTTTFKTRRIEGKPISYYFDCPGEAYGNSASTGDVYLSVYAQLNRMNAGTELLMTPTAIVVSQTGNRGSCTSSGKLEARIEKALQR